MEEIRGCFIDPTVCDERTEGDTGRSVWFLIASIQELNCHTVEFVKTSSHLTTLDEHRTYTPQ
jgi:hypothetical protein